MATLQNMINTYNGEYCAVEPGSQSSTILSETGEHTNQNKVKICNFS